MLHKPAKLLSFNARFLLLNEGFNWIYVAFEHIYCVRLNLVLACSTIFALEATLGSMHLCQLISIDVIRSVDSWLV